MAIFLQALHVIYEEVGNELLNHSAILVMKAVEQVWGVAAGRAAGEVVCMQVHASVFIILTYILILNWILYVHYMESTR